MRKGRNRSRIGGGSQRAREVAKVKQELRKVLQGRCEEKGSPKMEVSWVGLPQWFLE